MKIIIIAAFGSLCENVRHSLQTLLGGDFISEVLSASGWAQLSVSLRAGVFGAWARVFKSWHLICEASKQFRYAQGLSHEDSTRRHRNMTFYMHTCGTCEREGYDCIGKTLVPLAPGPSIVGIIIRMII